MSTQELKANINVLLEKTPDEALLKILEFLKKVNPKSENSLITQQNLAKILNEDKELLERLAK